MGLVHVTLLFPLATGSSGTEPRKSHREKGSKRQGAANVPGQRGTLHKLIKGKFAKPGPQSSTATADWQVLWSVLSKHGRSTLRHWSCSLAEILLMKTLSQNPQSNRAQMREQRFFPLKLKLARIWNRVYIHIYTYIFMFILYARRSCDYRHLAPQLLVACFRSVCQEPWLQVARLRRISIPTNKMLDCVQVTPCHGDWVMSLSIASRHWSLRADMEQPECKHNWAELKWSSKPVPKRALLQGRSWLLARHGLSMVAPWDLECFSEVWHFELSSPCKKTHRFESGTTETLGFPQGFSAHFSIHSATMFPLRKRSNTW